MTEETKKAIQGLNITTIRWETRMSLDPSLFKKLKWMRLVFPMSGFLEGVGHITVFFDSETGRQWARRWSI